jgi:uncharacterized membrane protein YgdD (TMEM256/DUF423 family)
MIAKYWLVLGAAIAAVAVAAGALGAHLLEKRLDEHQLKSFETAVRYQMFHAMALVLVGILADQQPVGRWAWPGGLFVAGIALFSGGIYAWLATGIRPLVHVVPVGGVCLILGWIALAVAAALKR